MISQSSKLVPRFMIDRAMCSSLPKACTIVMTFEDFMSRFYSATKQGVNFAQTWLRLRHYSLHFYAALNMTRIATFRIAKNTNKEREKTRTLKIKKESWNPQLVRIYVYLWLDSTWRKTRLSFSLFEMSLQVWNLVQLLRTCLSIRTFIYKIKGNLQVRFPNK